MDEGGLTPPVKLQSQRGIQRDVLRGRANLDRDVAKLGGTDRARHNATVGKNRAADHKRVGLKSVLRNNRAGKSSSSHFKYLTCELRLPVCMSSVGSVW